MELASKPCDNVYDIIKTPVDGTIVPCVTGDVVGQPCATGLVTKIGSGVGVIAGGAGAGLVAAPCADGFGGAVPCQDIIADGSVPSSVVLSQPCAPILGTGVGTSVGVIGGAVAGGKISQPCDTLYDISKVPFDGTVVPCATGDLIDQPCQTGIVTGFGSGVGVVAGGVGTGFAAKPCDNVYDIIKTPVDGTIVPCVTGGVVGQPCATGLVTKIGSGVGVIAGGAGAGLVAAPCADGFGGAVPCQDIIADGSVPSSVVLSQPCAPILGTGVGTGVGVIGGAVAGGKISQPCDTLYDISKVPFDGTVVPCATGDLIDQPCQTGIVTGFGSGVGVVAGGVGTGFAAKPCDNVYDIIKTPVDGTIVPCVTGDVVGQPCATGLVTKIGSGVGVIAGGAGAGLVAAPCADGFGGAVPCQDIIADGSVPSSVVLSQPCAPILGTGVGTGVGVIGGAVAGGKISQPCDTLYDISKVPFDGTVVPCATGDLIDQPCQTGIVTGFGSGVGVVAGGVGTGFAAKPCDNVYDIIKTSVDGTIVPCLTEDVVGQPCATGLVTKIGSGVGVIAGGAGAGLVAAPCADGFGGAVPCQDIIADGSVPSSVVLSQPCAPILGTGVGTGVGVIGGAVAGGKISQPCDTLYDISKVPFDGTVVPCATGDLIDQPCQTGIVTGFGSGVGVVAGGVGTGFAAKPCDNVYDIIKTPVDGTIVPCVTGDVVGQPCATGLVTKIGSGVGVIAGGAGAGLVAAPCADGFGGAVPCQDIIADGSVPSSVVLSQPCAPILGTGVGTGVGVIGGAVAGGKISQPCDTLYDISKVPFDGTVVPCATGDLIDQPCQTGIVTGFGSGVGVVAGGVGTGFAAKPCDNVYDIIKTPVDGTIVPCVTGGVVCATGLVTKIGSGVGVIAGGAGAGLVAAPCADGFGGAVPCQDIIADGSVPSSVVLSQPCAPILGTGVGTSVGVIGGAVAGGKISQPCDTLYDISKVPFDGTVVPCATGDLIDQPCQTGIVTGFGSGVGVVAGGVGTGFAAKPCDNVYDIIKTPVDGTIVPSML